MRQLYVIQNMKTGLLARHDCEGEHDGRFTDDISIAKEFWTSRRESAEAAEYSQNFGPDWTVQAVFDDPGHADMSRVYALPEDLGGIPQP